MAEKTVTINGYEFRIDLETGTTIARGELQDTTAARGAKAQINAGGLAREATVGIEDMSNTEMR